MRPYLVYVSSRHDWPVPPTWRSPYRTFDLAFAAYDQPPACPGADFQFHSDLEKFRGAKELMGDRMLGYEAVAFLDDDIEVDASRLDALFRIGLRLDYLVWQPALSAGSFYTWKCTVERPGLAAVPTDFVDVMCPFFSRAGLREALPLFDVNYGAFGLDVLWSHRWPLERKGVIHHLPVGHHRPIGSCVRRMPNGLTKREELDEVLRAPELRAYWTRLCAGV